MSTRLKIEFSGPKPSVSKGTRAIFQVNENDKLEEDKWDARAHGVNGEILALQVPTCNYAAVFDISKNF